ncbi:uncharacterized protein EI90DRAFT_2661920 [Cantharellus anzutake]|uniref:uncharacterized protein n=1 Tax=Cantharellus anzutake TaxID=1750568 RepID=UPI0019081103|nr:uncharacterized protein EI90DRAFT_2661920 [Cantharellus anzutake]KAF8337537.1 hypothetical protein EI90DRAFT_2661920 [Cantharellus anzutake]
MSGAIKLILRPPPNVDFLQGFPGVPAGPTRPHASVGGSVEVRVADSHPIKAKWIRIELRKIEMLPGQGNHFVETVGNGSFNIWSARDDWEVLTTRDIQFSIRIPENVPPSTALQNGNGIKYELVATICYKTKKGLFRRDTPTLISTSSQIIIDKHELHSAWPAYCQKDVRQVNKDGLTLTVERGNTCYGPGDRVVLHSSVQCGKTSVFVRSFEMALRETAVFRQIVSAGNKASNGPQISSNFVGSEKVTVNASIPAGGSLNCDLGCPIPTGHTSTTVVTAKYIEVIYSIAVRAMFEDGRDLVIDNIPVMMSNWPRNVSEETVRRIGHAPHLSLDAPPISSSPARSQNQIVNGANNSRTQSQPRPRPYSISERVGSSTPHPSTMGTSMPTVNEFGETARPAPNEYSQTTNGRLHDTSTQSAQSPSQNLVPGNRPPSSSGAGGGSRIGTKSVVNADTDSSTAGQQHYVNAADEKAMLARHQQMADEARMQSGPSDSAGQAQGPGQAYQQLPQQQSDRQWLSAEEEKRKQQLQSKLFNEAKQVAEATQASVGNPDGFSSQVPGAGQTAQWLTAGDEKQRMFEEAQATARRTQALAAKNTNAYVYDPSRASSPQYGAAGTKANVTNPSPKPVVQQEPMRVVLPPSTTPPHQRTAISTGASLYQQAMSSIPAAQPVPVTNPDDRHSAAPKFKAEQSSSTRPPAAPKQWPTALQEKEQMKYLEAKRAVERHQRVTSTDPVPYDALYPTNSTSNGNASKDTNRANSSGHRNAAVSNILAPGSPGQVPHQIAPSYVGGGSGSSSSSVRQNNMSNGPPPTPPPRRNTSTSTSSPPPTMSSIRENGVNGVPPYDQLARPLNALEEKALLSRKYAQEDAAVAAGPSSSNWADAPPPPASPPPPPSDTLNRPLNAAEEKARVKAQYEAADRAAASSIPSSLETGPPPPFDSQQWKAPPSPLVQAPDGMPQYFSPTTLGQYPLQSSYANGYANDSGVQTQSIPPPPPPEASHQVQASIPVVHSPPADMTTVARPHILFH